MLVKKINNQYLIVLPKETPIVSALTQIAKEEKILGGFITAIGAVKSAELGYYELEKKDYIRKVFNDQDYELISLNGNISKKDDQPFIHVHTCLGRSDFSVFGGHLFEATVAVTAEIYITPFGALPERAMQEDLGLQTISYCRIDPQDF